MVLMLEGTDFVYLQVLSLFVLMDPALKMVNAVFAKYIKVTFFDKNNQL